MDDRARFRRDYAPAFLQYLSEEGEGGLRAAYELGRRAMAGGLSMLDLAEVHHAELLGVLRSVRTPAELDQAAVAASRFFVELLATFEMAQRGFAELRQAAGGQVELQRATGILMERDGLAAEPALERLRGLAAEAGLAVEGAAARIVAGEPLAPGGSG
jgi:hypothetical protein